MFGLRAFGLLLLGLSLCCAAARADPLVFHVDPSHGSDGNTGTSASAAFATVRRAVEALTSQGPQLPDGGARIWLHTGTYDFANYTLRMSAANFNASAARPLIFSRAEGVPRGAVRFVGGVQLSQAKFRVADAATDAAVWGRLDAAARGNVRVYDLAADGITEYGAHFVRGFGKGAPSTGSPMELFCGDERMQLARWPNRGVTEPKPNISDFINITLVGADSSTAVVPDVAGTFVWNGTQDGQPWFYRQGLVGGVQFYLYRYTWEYNQRNYTAWFVSPNARRTYPDSSKPFWSLYSQDVYSQLNPSTSSGANGKLSVLEMDDSSLLYKGFAVVATAVNDRLFQHKFERPVRWTAAEDLWVDGFWKYLWADTAVPATVITENNTIRLDAATTYGVVDGSPWFAFNLLEEIDEAGEWYLDRTTGKLYIWPPAAGLSSCWVSQTTAPMIDLQSINGVEFSGISFEYSRAQKMVNVNGGSNNTFTNCQFKHSGLTFAAISGSSNGLMSCDLYDSANRAVSLSGGSRKDLIDGNNFVIDCEISKFGQIDMTYTPAVNPSGCGHIIRHNKFHDAPHTAVLFGGNEHKIEYNEIFDVCQFSSDAGTIYSGRDWGYRGNMIRFNFIHDIIGFSEDGYVQAVYIDDAASGMTVYGNVLYNIHGYATMDSGGRDNKFINNIIVKSNCATQTDCRATTCTNITGDSWNLLQRLTYDGIKYQEEPWASRYPELAVIPSDYAVMMAGNWTRPEGCYFSCNVLWENKGMLCEGNWGGTGGFGYYEEIANNLNDTDPLFADADNLDFNLQAGSPVLSMSCWNPIPFNSIGLLTDHNAAGESSNIDSNDDNDDASTAAMHFCATLLLMGATTVVVFM